MQTTSIVLTNMFLAMVGFSDPYVKVFYPHPLTGHQTQVKSLAVQKNLNPAWNFGSHTYVSLPSDNLQ
jgi:Ca2+-dependent lipid-binding protein